jgi:hypothetical protein
MSDRELPSLKQMRREAAICGTIWAIATVVVCGLCYALGYDRPDRPLGRGDVQAIWGIPRWFALGVLVPWMVCGVIAIVIALGVIRDDDLGLDHALDLEEAIHRGGEEIEGEQAGPGPEITPPHGEG